MARPMSSRPHIGLPSLTGGLERYADRFDLLEVRLGDGALPKPATLRAWRKKVPPSFVFSVVLPPVVGELKPSKALDEALEQSLEVARALEARCVVLVTPPSITPTDLNRKRLEALVTRIPSDAITLAWEARGVWETEDAAILAKRLGLVLVVDPEHDPAPEGPVAYLRLRGLGESTRIGPAALEKIASSLRERRASYVVIEADAPVKVAEGIRARLARKPSRLGGGTALGRVPRQLLDASDEEQ